jgi:hypothetical protein
MSRTTHSHRIAVAEPDARVAHDLRADPLVAAPHDLRAEPLVAAPHHLRASDAEREAVGEALRAHAAAGRLDPDELEQCLERAYAAELRADLLPLVADLPALERERPRRARSLPDLSPLVLLAVLLVAIWALTGAGYFWPVWPIGAMALSAMKHRGHRLRTPRERLRGA